MIEHWLSEDGRKAASRLSEAMREATDFSSEEALWDLEYTSQPARRALALLRDFGREYLEEHGIYVGGSAAAWEATDPDGRFVVSGSAFMSFDEINIAAILAVEVKT